MTHLFLNGILHARPFKPFRIFLKDGRMVERTTPGNMYATKSFGVSVGIPSEAHPDIAGDVVYFELSDIARVEVEGRIVEASSHRSETAA